MYLWRRRATPRWWLNHEENLRARFGNALAIIERPNRTQLQIEIVCTFQKDLRKLVDEFGGRITILPRTWYEGFARRRKAKPLKIGQRLLVARNGGFPAAAAVRKPPLLVIPAGTAFGTGEHATTAMSLRLLEKTSRKMETDWSLVDLGTGSGILALAAKSLGAKRVIGIDVDPIAIATARENARRNEINRVRFQVADVRSWAFPRKIDIVIANLFSELLLEILPKLKCSCWLILSGILREQESNILGGLHRHPIKVVEVRRRGKWIAMLARVG
jgi:ribosomal protein L11 methyltransferase